MVSLFRSEVDRDSELMAKNLIGHIFIIDGDFYMLVSIGSQSCIFIDLKDGQRWDDSFDGRTLFTEMELMVEGDTIFEYLGKCDIELFQKEKQI